MDNGEEYDFRGEPPRISELIQQATAGDLSGFAGSVEQAMTVSRDDAMIWAVIIALLINAVSNLIRRTGDAARPITEAVAENMREANKAD